jgi:hypothetical protein
MENQTTLLSEVSTNQASVAFNGLGRRHVVMQVAMTGFTGTVKFAGSNADAVPAFGSAASNTNPWDFVKGVNLIDGSAVNGGTGLVGAATTAVYQVEMNTNLMKWFSAIISGAAGGTITVKAIGINDDV